MRLRWLNLIAAQGHFFVTFEAGGGGVLTCCYVNRNNKNPFWILAVAEAEPERVSNTRPTSRPQSHVWPNKGQLMVQSHACMCIPSSAPEAAQGLFVFMILPR